MDPEYKKTFRSLDRIINLGGSLAVWRIPGEDAIHYIQQEPWDSRILLYDIAELNGQDGFVVAPFMADMETPIVLIKSEHQMVVDFDFTMDCPNGMDSEMYRQILNSQILSEEDKVASEEYVRRFDVFVNALREKEFNKLVLSRSRMMAVPKHFSPAFAFYEACCRYIHSYVYLCYTPETGTWLGSTPEIILSGGAERDWQTVALAGTQSLINGQLPEEWDDKNRKEQQYVASYVRKKLHSFGVQPVETGPYPAYAGALSHLKTDFRFTLPDNDRLGDLLKLLHPTPAVCGLPKKKAYRFILENEGHNRRYYSGFIGKLDPDGNTDLYVNLRCMNIRKQTVTLYAGGGLLDSSELEDEWQETEVKMHTMFNLLES